MKYEREGKTMGDEWLNDSWPQCRTGYPRVEGQTSNMNTRLNHRRIDNEEFEHEGKVVGDEWMNDSWPQCRTEYPRVEARQAV